MNFFYNPFSTAISRKDLSAPLKFLLKNDLILKGEKILDFGSGKGKDTEILRSKGYNCTPFDKFHDNDEISNENVCTKNNYDVIICNYVFNVIETKDEFRDTLKFLRSIKAGRVYISIRTDVSAIKPNWEYSDYNDNYFTGRTHQRFIKEEDMQDYFGDHMVLKETSAFRLIKLK
ncbi:MAG: methyltransferase domain-containing protein [Sarcina sp.]